MKTIKRLFSYIKYHWQVFVMGNILLIISVVLGLIMPRLGKYIIDEIIHKHVGAGLFPWQELMSVLALYALVGIAAAILDFVAKILLVKSSNQFTETMRNQVYDHIHKMPISYFDQVPAGTIVSRITNDTETIRQSFYVQVFSTLLVALAKIVGVYVAIFLLRWEVGIFLLLLIPGVYLFQKVYRKRATEMQAEIREINGKINGTLNENIKNVQLTQSYGREEKVMADFKALTAKQLEINERFYRFDWGMFNITFALSSLVMFMAVSWLLYGHLNLNMPVTVGFVYLIVNYVSQLFVPITAILDVLATIVKSIVSAERVFNVLDQPIEDDGKGIMDHVTGNMTASDIHFAYIEGQEVLKGIDFKADPGQMIAIVGPTGSGKSSLLNLLYRFYDPQEGRVLMDGTDIRDLERNGLRSHMGIVLQDPFLIEGTIYDNISLGNPAISKEMAIEALLKVGGKPLLDQHEKGIDEPISERGKNLSKGQRQLISFARALAYNPKVLILDEATASIDTETEQIIQKAMEVVQEGRTTIVIAHRLSTIRDADCIYVLVDGKIVEQGTHDELVARKGFYENLLHHQLSRAGQQGA